MQLFRLIKNSFASVLVGKFSKLTATSIDKLSPEKLINNKELALSNQHPIFDFAYMTVDKLLHTLDTHIFGLGEESVEQKRASFGLNQVDQDAKDGWFIHLWLCYRNPFNLLLTILAIISYLTHDMAGTVVISLMVLISTALRFIQEKRSNNAAENLKHMVSTTATVYRDNVLSQSDIKYKVSEIPIKELVPGDVLALCAGDMIPADVRIISCKDLFVSQASLTGEALPVEKFSYIIKQEVDSLLDLSNIGFMGTNIVSGSATAVVVAIGKQTLFGGLANKVLNQEYAKNAFQKSINKISWLLISFMSAMVPIVFVLNWYTKGDWLSSALFALSIAVGLTPEMLPMVVTSSLAKGAVFMSRKRVIVKHLDAIQNFGAMDILCTDKTGTLTQDKIFLAKHTDIFGNEFDDVFEYAYLNSYYQTGLKNLLDVAVLEQNNFGDIPELIKKFKKFDEIPFDFVRRRMSVIVSGLDNTHTLICKGAVEEMMSCCTSAYYNDEVIDFTDDLLQELTEVKAQLNADGLRVVAVAIKHYKAIKTTYSIADEVGMTLLGYMAFLDPPKETTRPAIQALHDLGVKVKILTGDNELVTAKICREVNLDVEGTLLGAQIDQLSDAELARISESTTIFAKLTPLHKERIVQVLHDQGHVVGFMGDGINDAPAIRAADIGISVDTAVDIAKEAADIILLEKSLLVLEHGIEEGRKTFANMLKYIKITASSNFGNVFSVLIASAFLPFQPMLPIHLLIQNLLYDISQIVIPFDNVDTDFIRKPQTWNPSEIRSFMIFFGPLSSIFDVMVFYILWHVYKANTIAHQAIFQSGWFIEGLITQILIVHAIRTRKIPFIQSSASWPLIGMGVVMISIGIYLPQGPMASYIKMAALPYSYFVWVVVISMSYIALVQAMKYVYTKVFTW